MRKQLIKFDVISSTDRLYRAEEFTKTRVNEYNTEYTILDVLNSGFGVYGEFGHPNRGDLDSRVLNPSHHLSNFSINNGWLEADVKVFSADLNTYLDEVVFRIRAFGSLKEGTKEVDLDEVIGFDAVHHSNDAYKDL